MTEHMAWSHRSTVVRHVLTGCVLALLGGCASMSDKARTMAEGVTAGAVVGGGAGYLVGEEKGAVIGATVGAVAGAAVAAKVNEKKEAYARDEDELQLTLAALQQSITELRSANQQLVMDTQALRRRQKALQSQQLSEKARQAELRSQKEFAAERIASVNARIAKVDQQLVTQRQLVAAERARGTGSVQLINFVQKSSSDLSLERETLLSSLEQLKAIDSRRMY